MTRKPEGLSSWWGILFVASFFVLLSLIWFDVKRQRPLSDQLPFTLSEQRDRIVRLEAELAGVPVTLALAVSHVENTSGDSMAVSSAGAVGLMQVIPKIWQHSFEDECGCGSLFLRHRNACVGVRVLKFYRDKHGTWDEALRAYHGSLKLPTLGRQYVSWVLDKAFPADGTTAPIN